MAQGVLIVAGVVDAAPLVGSAVHGFRETARCERFQAFQQRLQQREPAAGEPER